MLLVSGLISLVGTVVSCATLVLGLANNSRAVYAVISASDCAQPAASRQLQLRRRGPWPRWGQGIASQIEQAPAAGIHIQVQAGPRRQAYLWADPNLHQMTAILQPAGEQLLVAQGFAMAHFGLQVAVGGGS